MNPSSSLTVCPKRFSEGFPLAAPNRRSVRRWTLPVHGRGFFFGLHAKYTMGKVYLDGRLALLLGLSDSGAVTFN